MSEERNILAEMLSSAMLPHPSGECRCVFPGTNIHCRLDAIHDGDHRGDPFELTTGAMSPPVQWPQRRPQELSGDDLGGVS